MSRLISSFSSTPKGTICSDSVNALSRVDWMITGSLKSPTARYCTNAGWRTKIDDRRAAVVLEIDAQMRLGAGIRPLDAVVGIEHHHAFRQRPGAADEAIERESQVALARRAQPHAVIRARRTQAPRCRGPRAPATSIGPDAHRASASSCEQVPGDDRQRAHGDHRQRGSHALDQARRERKHHDKHRRRQTAQPDGIHVRLAPVVERIAAQESTPLSWRAQAGSRCRARSRASAPCRAARAHAAGGVCERRSSAPRCRRDRPRPGRADACGCARAPDAP